MPPTTTITKGRSLRDAIIEAATKIRLAGTRAADSLGGEEEGSKAATLSSLPAATAALSAAAAAARVASARAGLIFGGGGDQGAPPPPTSSADAISVVDALSSGGEAAVAAGGSADRAALAALPSEISALFSKEIETRLNALSSALIALVESTEGVDEIGGGASETRRIRQAAGQAISAAEAVEKAPTPFQFLVSQLEAAVAEVEGAAEEAEELAKEAEREGAEEECDGERQGTAAEDADEVDVDFECAPLSARECAAAAAVAKALRCCSTLLSRSLSAV